MDVLVLEERETLKFLAQDMFFGGGALGSLGAFKSSTHPVIPIFLYPLRAASCALEADEMRALDIVEAVGALDLLRAAGFGLEVDAMRALNPVEAVGALDLVEVEVVGLSLNIL
ncbi:hypothetical protein Tco_1534586, partial [Tanacetum coccineum]